MLFDYEIQKAGYAAPARSVRGAVPPVLRAHDFTISQLLEILSEPVNGAPRGDRTDVTIKQNLLYYMRKYKNNQQYSAFLSDVYRKLAVSGVFNVRRAPSGELINAARPHPERPPVPTVNDEHTAAIPSPVSTNLAPTRATPSSVRQSSQVPSSSGGEHAPRTRRAVTINVDTRFRDSPFDKRSGEVTETGDIFFSLDERVKNVRKLTLSSFEFPNSSYSVTSKLRSNCFFIEVTRNTYQVKGGTGTGIEGTDVPAAAGFGTTREEKLAIIRTLNTATDVSSYKTINEPAVDILGGETGVYKITMLNGNYNRDKLITTLNSAFRYRDVSSGLAAITVDLNIAYNRIVIRTINKDTDLKSTDMIWYPGIPIVDGDGQTRFGGNPIGGLVHETGDPRFNMYFDLYDELRTIDGPSGSRSYYDLARPLTPRPLYFNFGWVLGFRRSTYMYAADYRETVATTTDGVELSGFSADSPYDVNNMRYFYFCLTDYVSSNNDTFLQGLRSGSVGGALTSSMYSPPQDVLARVVNSTPKLTVAFFNPSDFIRKSREYDVPVNLKNFRVRLLDEYGRPMDLNGMDWSAALELETEVS